MFVDFNLTQLRGLSTFTYGFDAHHTLDPTQYNNWEFTIDEWDYFWNSPNNTMLFGTNPYVLGEQNVDLISTHILPERFVFKDQKVKTEIFGIPIEFEDEHHSEVSYKRH